MAPSKIHVLLSARKIFCSLRRDLCTLDPVQASGSQNTIHASRRVAAEEVAGRGVSDCQSYGPILPNTAVVAYASNLAQHDVGDDLGHCIPPATLHHVVEFACRGFKRIGSVSSSRLPGLEITSQPTG